MAVELATGYVSLVPSAKDFGKELAKQIGAPVEKESKESGDKAGDSFLSGFGGKLKAGALAIGAAVGATVVAGLSGALAQGRAQDRIAASLGLDAQGQAALGKAAGEAYTAGFGESIEDASAAAASVIRANLAGAGSAELDDLTKQALALAEVFELDVAEATNFAAVAIRNGLAKDGTEAFDLLVTGMQRVPEAIRGELIDATNEYGPMLTQLGYTGEQAMALLIKGAEGGQIALDKTGDALKEFTIRATDMSTSTQDAYKTLGLDTEEMTNAILAGGESAQQATGKIIDALLALEDPGKRANTAIALFGTPLEDLGTGQIPQFLEALRPTTGALGDFAGAADRVGDQLTDNAGTKIDNFRRKVMVKLTDFIGNTVIPTVERELVPIIREHLVPAFELASQWVGDVVERVRTNWPQIMATVRPVIDTLSSIIRDFVTTATSLWEMFGDNILGFVEAVWPSIQNIIEGALTVIRGIVQTVTALIRGDWSAVWDGIQSIVSGAWQAIGGIVTGAIETVKATLGAGLEAVKHIFSTAWEGVKSLTRTAADAVFGFFRDLPGRIVGLGASMLNAGKEVAGKILDGILDGISAAGGAAADFAKAFGDALLRFVDDKVLGALRSGLLWMAKKLAGVNIPGIGRGFDAASSVLEDIAEGLHVPGYDDGGIVEGRRGEAVLALVHAGETILPTHRMSTADALAEVGVGSAARGGNTYVLNTTVVESHATVAQQFRRMELAAGFA